MIKVDFHVHTSCSDGILSPQEIMERAHTNKLKYLAITDHDTLSALEGCIADGEKYGIRLIPGIELSTQHNDESVHILGFFKDDNYKNNDLINELKKIKDHRVIRAQKMVEKLHSEFNIDIDFEKMCADSRDTIARPHIARAIIAAGYPYDFEYIFNNFIGKGCKAYVPTLKVSTEEGIDLLKKYNALVFLAHPKLIFNSKIDEFLDMKLDGIEAVYFQNTSEETEYYMNIAKENNLLISCGSDFHGNIDSDPRHGDIGSMSLSQVHLHKLLDALEIEYTDK